MTKVIINLKHPNQTIEITKFLLCVQNDKRELYILHREYPSCLIYVEQTLPVNFVVFDLYEENEEEATKILISKSFKSELKEFWSRQVFKDLN